MDIMLSRAERKYFNFQDPAHQKRSGGVVRQGKGDDIFIKMPNGRIITIPVSGDLKIVLFKSAIRKAGLDDEDFLP